MIARLSIAAVLLCAALPAAAQEPARAADTGVRKECTLQPTFTPPGKMAMPVVRCATVAPEYAGNRAIVRTPAEAPVARD